MIVSDKIEAVKGLAKICKEAGLSLSLNHNTSFSFNVPLNIADTILQKCFSLGERRDSSCIPVNDRCILDYQVRLAMAGQCTAE